MLCASRGHFEVAEMLLAAGADVHIRNKLGATALELTDNLRLRQLLLVRAVATTPTR